MLQYEFMQKAFIVGLLISIIIPCIGQILILRKYAMLGDALSHIALAGVCCGILIGYNPTMTAVIFCILACLIVAWIGRNIQHNKEIAIAIILSFGVGLSGILSSYINSSINLNSFLFGSIVAISNQEFLTIIILSFLILGIYILYYYPFMYYSYYDTSNNTIHKSITSIDFIFTFMIGITISISARIVGALIISSLLVIPCACGLLLGKSYKSTLISSIVLSVIFTFVGLTLAYYFDLRPGGSIVILSCIVYLILLKFKK